MSPIQLVRLLLAFWLLGMLYGCTDSAREQIFDHTVPTVESIWYGTSANTGLAADIVGMNVGGESGAAAWTRSATSELDWLFPTLHNPRIHLYIFPHLSPDGHPVPGYLTHFHLYTKTNNWALPGEVYQQGRYQ